MNPMNLPGYGPMLSTEQDSLHLEFALKEPFACIQNIADGRDVMGVLSTGYGNPSYTQLSLVFFDLI